MKKTITILAMLLIVATAHTQTSRRPANSNTTAKRSTKEATSSTKRTTTQTSRKPSNDAIVKTKPNNSRTYHHNENAQGRKSTVNSRATVNTQNNRGTNSSMASTTRTRETTASKDAHRTNYSPGNRVPTQKNRAGHYTTRETNQVTKNSATSLHHGEYRSPRQYRDRHTVVHHYNQKPAAKTYRAKHYAYHRPAEFNIIWTPVMHRHYIRMYPMVKYWSYTNGYRISMVSAYDAEYYRGEVRTVYGKAREVYYSRTTDEYFLYYGLYYPYQDFTVVIPGYIARRYSNNPQRYFTERRLAVTGLITNFNGEPEIVVKESFQINLY